MDYCKLIAKKNLFKSWSKFSSGKTGKEDVIEFWRDLESGINSLHNELVEFRYEHSTYQRFKITDPKKRNICKAEVRDRIVHQAVFYYLHKIFDKRFIYDSYSSRTGKGTHNAVKRLKKFCDKQSKNGFVDCYILKCDIEKFFDSMDHNLLLKLIKSVIYDKNIIRLVKNIIESYSVSGRKGIPLGNMTSQIFANIYLHELDRYVKNELKMKYYVRFNDDFVLVDQNRGKLEQYFRKIQDFITNNLKLNLPDKKSGIFKYKNGVDFLGYKVFPRKIEIRKKTKNRMIYRARQKLASFENSKISLNDVNKAINSYLGTIKHSDEIILKQKLKFIYEGSISNTK